MLTVSQHLSQNPNEKLEIAPAFEALKALPGELGTVDGLLADAGYFSEANVESCIEESFLLSGLIAISTTKVSKNVSPSLAPYPRTPMPSRK